MLGAMIDSWALGKIEQPWFNWDESILRVATTRGKQRIWMFIFPDRENKGIYQKYLKHVFAQGIYLQHKENFEILKL